MEVRSLAASSCSFTICRLRSPLASFVIAAPSLVSSVSNLPGSARLSKVASFPSVSKIHLNAVFDLPEAPATSVRTALRHALKPVAASGIAGSDTFSASFVFFVGSCCSSSKSFSAADSDFFLPCVAAGFFTGFLGSTSTSSSSSKSSSSSPSSSFSSYPV